ncbi:MAG: UvrB/UvrC motif-containing protein [Acetobacter sp.]|nr:UvrB/UvrC motif-containing protein [Bacteroides sp.]MCM1340929.1 UvrB/UvrC motif-containing protein [Acetobacter sp.]MCM1432515.1 UvrB/UvrC motif-containing protein [Clostridiales bacterium]
MLCQHCNQNEATTHIKRNINGQREEMHLCSECAKELGVMEEFKMPSMSEFLSESLFGSLLGSGASAMNSIAEIERCRTCGSSFDDIVNSGHIGCSDCYDKFSERLEPSIRKIHGKTKHLGKFISYTQQDEKKNKFNNKDIEKENPVEALKKDLEQAVKEQRFEDAATLRDKINELEGHNG